MFYPNKQILFLKDFCFDDLFEALLIYNFIILFNIIINNFCFILDFKVLFDICEKFNNDINDISFKASLSFSFEYFEEIFAKY